MDAKRWAKIEALYHAALAKSPGERAAYIDACAEEPDVRREVESLLLGASEPVAVRKRIGPYEILGLLGAGGMGEVYRARDTRLKREVALKVLPEAFANNPDRMARFQREAEVLASINHPNIAHVYGLEDRAIVMELVEGETLSSRLPLDTALNYAHQIADALEYAHEKGIIHRDLKPANIKVTPEGVVKLLDFGLAKALIGPESSTNPSDSPTLTVGGTAAGVILGTAAYMSPEQARGKALDRRTDIWSFGVVLYEMLTGRQLFKGDTVSDVLAAVLRADFDWLLLPRDTPQSIGRLLRRCLERDSARRLRDMGDAKLELEEARTPQPESQIAPTAPQVRRFRPYWLLAIGILALASLALTFIHFHEVAPDAPVVRFQVPDPDMEQSSSRLALSPDGKSLAFVVVGADGRSRIWVRRLDSLDARLLVSTDASSPVFWSPDNRWIAFTSGGKLRKIPVAGGPPQTLCNVSSTVPGGSWNSNGDIIFGRVPHAEGLFRVYQAGGDPVQVTATDASQNEATHIFPQFLPDGRHFIYLANSSDAGKSAMYLASLDGKQRKRLLTTTRAAIYAPPQSKSGNGHLLFLRDDTLMAQTLDSRTFDLLGDAYPVAEQVGSLRNYSWFTASDTGVVAYRSKGSGGATFQLTWFDRTGKSIGTAGLPGIYSGAALSPDGRRIAVSKTAQDFTTNLWLIAVDRDVTSRLTTGPGPDIQPVWTPDGKRLVFASYQTPGFDLYQRDAAGVESEKLLLRRDTASKYPFSISPDGKMLLYGSFEHNGLDLWVMPLDGEPKPAPFVVTRFNQGLAQFSPAGTDAEQWIAYTSDKSGVPEIYVQAYPAGVKYPISTGGGREPRWRGDGKELFYLDPASNLMSVQIKTTPRFEAGEPHKLFTAPVSQYTKVGGLDMVEFHYAVASDGRRFLVNALTRPPEQTTPITVVLNWEGLLKAK